MKQRNVLRCFLIALAFGLLFAFYYFTDQESFKAGFLEAVAKVPSIRNYGGNSPHETIKFFQQYGAAIVGGFALLSWLASLILLGILKLVRLAKFKFVNLVALLFVYSLYLAFAIELLYYEKHYTVASNGLIYFVGQPLYSASIATLVFIVIVFILPCVISFWKKKKAKAEIDPPASGSAGSQPEKEVIKPAQAITDPEKPSVTSSVAKLLVVLALAMTSEGCSLFSGTESLACKLAPDSVHCYQDEAVSSGDPAVCEKIIQPEKFKSIGSNPPKDKCYLMVAQNTGDLNACNNIKGGLMSYTVDECVLETSVENQLPEGCQKLTGASKTKCVETLGPLMTADKVLEVDSQIEILQNELKKGSDPQLEKQLAGLQEKRNDMLAIMSKDNKSNYDFQSDPVNKEIVGEFTTGKLDGSTKDRLISINEKLRASGAPMTKEQYEAVRDYLKYVNDPENDIEKMDDAKIVKDRFNEKVGNMVDKLKFWNSKDTAQEKTLDQQLRFYERMLERQEAIDKGLSEKEMNYENTVDKIGEKAKEKGLDIAKEKFIEHVFGEAAGLSSKATTAVLGEALNTVQKEARSAEFRGLTKAYDDGMAEELSKSGGDVDKAHAIVIKKLSADPYTYASGDSFAKYGNLVENKDCDGTNPHCINTEVFWKAMKKSYKYQHPAN